MTVVNDSVINVLLDTSSAVEYCPALYKLETCNGVYRILHCVAGDDALADEATRASWKEKYNEQKRKDIIDESFITGTIWIPDIDDPRLLLLLINTIRFRFV